MLLMTQRSLHQIVRLFAGIATFSLTTAAFADQPAAAYIFPAGAQRGTSVKVRVGGIYLRERCGFEMLGQGVTAPAQLERTKTIWFEGPVIPQPPSQAQEDYPKDMAGEITLSADAVPGGRAWRVWTA